MGTPAELQLKVSLVQLSCVPVLESLLRLGRAKRGPIPVPPAVEAHVFPLGHGGGWHLVNTETRRRLSSKHGGGWYLINTEGVV